MSEPCKESVHSFIYRKLNLFGSLTATGLLGRNGWWLKKPYVMPGGINIFSDFNKDFLLELLRGSNIAIIPNGLFENPQKYIIDYNYVFLGSGGRERCVGEIEVAFCPECIREQITNLGYGYFFASWMRGNWCEVHNQGLYYIPKTNMKSSLEMIETILRGNIPVESIKHLDRKRSDSLNISSQEVKWTPCLKKSLLSWVRNNFDKFSDEFFEANRVFNRDEWYLMHMKSCLYDYGPSGNRLYSDTLSMYVKILHKTDQHLLERFYQGRFSVREVSLQTANGNFFSEKLAINTNYNCTRCEFYPEEKCAVQQVIYQGKLSALGDAFTSNHLNYCDYHIKENIYYWKRPKPSLSEIRDNQILYEW